MERAALVVTRRQVKARRAARITGLRGREQAIFLLPAAAFVVVFYVLPNALNFVMSLTDWSTYKSGINFIATGNFSRLLLNGDLLEVIGRTFLFALIVAALQNVIGLALALALEEPTRLNIALRALFFVPVLLSSLAAGYIVRGLLDPHGIVNALLSIPAEWLTGQPIDYGWLGDRRLSLLFVAIAQAWKWSGITMLVYITGLSAVPRDLIEAARVDGASTGQIIRRVKLPLLGPALTFNLTLTVIAALASFDMIVSMTGGGPGGATQVLNFVVWQTFASGRFGEASAIGLVLLLIVAGISLPMAAKLRRREVRL